MQNHAQRLKFSHWLVLAATVSPLYVACGPGRALQPLVGETPDVQLLLDVPLANAFDDAPTLAARNWLAAVRDGNWEATWEGLSTELQTLLRARLPVDDQPHVSGAEVIERTIGGTAPAKRSERLLGVAPVAVRPFPPGIEPERPPDPSGPRSVQVYLYTNSAEAVALPMQFDGSHWRIAELSASWMSAAQPMGPQEASRSR